MSLPTTSKPITELSPNTPLRNEDLLLLSQQTTAGAAWKSSRLNLGTLSSYIVGTNASNSPFVTVTGDQYVQGNKRFDNLITISCNTKYGVTAGIQFVTDPGNEADFYPFYIRPTGTAGTDGAKHNISLTYGGGEGVKIAWQFDGDTLQFGIGGAVKIVTPTPQIQGTYAETLNDRQVVNTKWVYDKAISRIDEMKVELDRITNTTDLSVYVSNNGNDQNDGLSQNKAVRSLYKAVNVIRMFRSKTNKFHIAIDQSTELHLENDSHMNDNSTHRYVTISHEDSFLGSSEVYIHPYNNSGTVKATVYLNNRCASRDAFPRLMIYGNVRIDNVEFVGVSSTGLDSGYDRTDETKDLVYAIMARKGRLRLQNVSFRNFARGLHAEFQMNVEMETCTFENCGRGASVQAQSYTSISNGLQVTNCKIGVASYYGSTIAFGMTHGKTHKFAGIETALFHLDHMSYMHMYRSSGNAGTNFNTDGTNITNTKFIIAVQDRGCSYLINRADMELLGVTFPPAS